MAVPAGQPSEPVSALRAHLGAQLRKRRDEAGLTQAALAMRVRYARAYVAQVESARELPSAAFVLACDQVLDARGALMEIFRRIDNERRAQRRAAPATLTLAHAEGALWTPDDGPEAPPRHRRPPSIQTPSAASSSAT
jgi:transcriptional regulator with XRE-family HTH domain